MNTPVTAELLADVASTARDAVQALAGHGPGRRVHRVTATVTFTRRSGTRARTLRVTFSRCARRSVTPKFPG